MQASFNITLIAMHWKLERSFYFCTHFSFLFNIFLVALFDWEGGALECRTIDCRLRIPLGTFHLPLNPLHILISFYPHILIPHISSYRTLISSHHIIISVHPFRYSLGTFKVILPHPPPSSLTPFISSYYPPLTSSYPHTSHIFISSYLYTLPGTHLVPYSPSTFPSITFLLTPLTSSYPHILTYLNNTPSYHHICTPFQVSSTTHLAPNSPSR